MKHLETIESVPARPFDELTTQQIDYLKVILTREFYRERRARDKLVLAERDENRRVFTRMTRMEALRSLAATLYRDR